MMQEPRASAASAARALFLLATAFALASDSLADTARAIHVPAPAMYLLGMLLAAAAVRRLARQHGAEHQPPSLRIHPHRGGAWYARAFALVAISVCAACAYVWLVVAPLGFDLSSIAETSLWSADFFVAAFLYVLIGPIVEEYYFRQLLHREFRVIFGRPVLYVAANAIWFAAIHDPASIPVALVVGTCCTMLRTVSGGITLPIIAHMSTNLALDLVGSLR
jgi:membrane protease YdiL (CAAX protease family)